MSTEHFVPADAIEGVKGSKPRFKSAREELPSLNRDYLESRNAKLKAQTFLVEAQAREKAGELISKRLAIRQAQYILICLRQSILNFPTRYARQMIGLPSEHKAKQVLTKAAYEFLTELADFPSKISDPGWMKTLEAGGLEKEPIRPSSGQEIKRELEKAKRRRAAKTKVMQNLRARGMIA